MAKYTLSRPALPAQIEFVETEAQFPAMVAGFGSGKTEGGIMRLLKKKIEQRHLPVADYLPTYGLINDIILPRLETIFTNARLPYQYNQQRKTMSVRGYGQIIFRTLDNPDKIVGYEVADSIVDELDTLPIEKAKKAWRQIIARNRAKKTNGQKNTVGVVTTPEGFRFVHEQWVTIAPAGYQIIKASTYDNIFLPEGYIDGLLATYPPELIMAYLNGDFVNLNGKTVYSNFERHRNATDRVTTANHELHIGLDFNVGNMSAVIHIIDDETLFAVDEIGGALDTPEMIELIRARFPVAQYPNIYVYPDASGGSRKTNNASATDIQLLNGAGFIVDAPQTNPAVRDRVLTMQHLFLSKGRTRYFVNIERCKKYVESLEQQVYNDAGAPDKTGGFDHFPDAGGYLCHRRFGLQNLVNGRIVRQW